MNKKTVEKISKEKLEKKDIEKVLGKCHDGDDYRILMKDETVRIVPKDSVPKELIK